MVQARHRMLVRKAHLMPPYIVLQSSRSGAWHKALVSLSACDFSDDKVHGYIPALELRKHKITVNSYCPGWIVTSLSTTN